MEALNIDGAWVVTRRPFTDERGSFREWFRADDFEDTFGYGFDLAQANCSMSQQGVIRGIHFADVPPGQAKYVACAHGAIVDVVVDVRTGSPTFGQWTSQMLDASAGQSLFIAEGLGHAWAPLTPTATVIYLCSEPYNAASERAVSPLDPELGITWPTFGYASLSEPVLSAKDTKAPTLAKARKAGILPRYQDCLYYQAQR